MALMTEPSPDEVRDAGREIFGRDEFQRTISPIQRFLEWLFDWIQRLLERLTPGDSVNTPAGAGLGQLLAYVVIFLLAVALVVLIVYVIRRAPARRRRDKDRSDGVSVEVEDIRTVDEWKSLAEQWEAEGRWKDALRARYRELVRSLIDGGILPPVPGRTTRELLDDMVIARPDVSDAFDQATRLFEVAWYADEPTGPDENRRFRYLAADVTARAAHPATADLVGATS